MIKRSRSYKIFSACNILILTLLCVTMLFPYLNQLAIALNEGTDTAKGGISIWPRKFTLENFAAVLNDSNVLSATLVSVSRTVITVVFSLIVTFSSAYALTRRSLKGHKFITLYYIVTMYIGAGMIPTYILYRHLGLMNSFWVYVIPFGMSVYNMLIMRSFIEGIPVSLEESALIDGANEIQVMYKIIIPLSKPVLATVALWVAVGQWNDYTTSLYYVTERKLFTLQYMMMRMIKQGEAIQAMIADALKEGADVSQLQMSTTTSASTQAAMLIVTTVPIICVYPFLQKYFVKGVTLGAVKG